MISDAVWLLQRTPSCCSNEADGRLIRASDFVQQIGESAIPRSRPQAEISPDFEINLAFNFSALLCVLRQMLILFRP